jgi:hypothetical protein
MVSRTTNNEYRKTNNERQTTKQSQCHFTIAMHKRGEIE